MLTLTLRTKDPARNGNGILYGAVQSELTGDQLLLVETDFGNKMRLTSGELNSLFSFGQVVDYDEWKADRRALQEEIPNMTETATPQDILDRSGSAIIGLGNGVDLELTRDGDLQITEWNGQDLKGFVPLGKGTTSRLIQIRNALEQLIIHAIPT